MQPPSPGGMLEKIIQTFSPLSLPSWCNAARWPGPTGEKDVEPVKQESWKTILEGNWIYVILKQDNVDQLEKANIVALEKSSGDGSTTPAEIEMHEWLNFVSPTTFYHLVLVSICNSNHHHRIISLTCMHFDHSSQPWRSRSGNLISWSSWPSSPWWVDTGNSHGERSMITMYKPIVSLCDTVAEVSGSTRSALFHLTTPWAEIISDNPVFLFRLIISTHSHSLMKLHLINSLTH